MGEFLDERSGSQAKSVRAAMQRRAAALLAGIFLLAASARAASAAATLRAVDDGLLVAAPGGDRVDEVVTMNRDLAAALIRVPVEGKARITEWPVSPGVRRAVTLTRHDVYAPDARVVKITPEGEVEVPRSRWLFFWGSDDGGSASIALSVDPDAGSLSATSFSEEGILELKISDAGSRKYRLAAPEAPATGASWTCGEETLPPVPPATARTPASASVRPDAVTALTKIGVVAIDTDNEYMLNRFADNTTNATNYIASLFANVNVIYERDVSLRLLQGYTILRVSSVADPYVQATSGNASGAKLNEFGNYWNAHYGGVRRTVAAILSGKQPGGGASGIAWIGGLCSTFSGYSFNQLFTSNYLAGDTLILAHEIGHNFGSPHTHCYSPPADMCYASEAGCYSGATSCPAPLNINGYNATGTLMSYCHLSPCSSSTTLAFHPRSLSEYINADIAGASACIFNVAGSPAPAPTVSAINPAVGVQAGGTPVTVTGSNFSANPTVAFVDLTGSVSLTVGVTSGVSISATTPAHSGGVMDVVVMNSDYQTGTLRNGFSYLLPAPTISGISPTFGSTGGGAKVTIAGANFQPGASVTIGNPATGVTFVDSTTLTATTVTHAAGTVSVVVTNPDAQTGTLSNSFTYNTGVGFYTVTPCRVVDTRNANGPYGGPALAAGGTRAFTIGGQCGIPANARAVAVNVAVTQPTAGPGFVTLYPGGTNLPVAATINYSAGQTRANNAVVPLGAAGDVLVKCGQGSGTVQLILDVNGYFQ